MRKIALLSALVVAFASPMTASHANDIPDTAIVPTEAMSALKGMLGKWSVKTEMINPEGAWATQGSDSVSIKARLNNMLFAETHTERLSGQSLVVETDYSYDQYRQVYRARAMDDTFGLMDIYEGNLENGILVLTNIRAGTSFPLDETRQMNFRLTVPVTGDERVMEIDQSIDAGETWSSFFKLTYQRIGTP